MTAGRSWVALRPGVRGQLQARTDHHENHRTPVSSFLASQVPPTKQTQAILYFSWSWNMFSYYSNLSTLKSSLDQCYGFPGGGADPGAPPLLPPPPRNTLLSSTTSLPSLTSALCQCGPAYSTKFDHSLSHRSSQSGVRRSGAAPGGEGALLGARRGTAVNDRENPRT